MSAFTDSIAHYCEGLHVAPGASACCSECLDAYDIEDTGDIDAMQEQLYDIESGGFSWSQCDSCGSTFGGDRHDAHGIAVSSTGFVADYDPIHMSICSDCLLFHANGDEPEDWHRTPADAREAEHHDIR